MTIINRLPCRYTVLIFNKFARGFTLFEVVVVIALSATIFSFSSYFYIGFVKNNLEYSARLSYLEKSIITREILSRYLSNTLAGSVRLSNNKQCIHFMQIVGAGGFYQGEILQGVNDIYLDESAQRNINEASYIAMVKNTHSASQLNATVDNIIPIFSLSPQQLMLANSINIGSNNLPHFFLLSSPMAFCINDKKILLFKNLRRTNNNINLQASHAVLVSGIHSAQAFELEVVSKNQRNVYIDIVFGDKTSAIKLNATVAINHAP